MVTVGDGPHARHIQHGTAGSATASSWIIHHAADGANIRKEPAVSSLAHRGFTHLGMDVSKNSISVAVLEPDSDHAVIDRIFHDEASVRRLINAFPDRRLLYIGIGRAHAGRHLCPMSRDITAVVGGGGLRDSNPRPPPCKGD
jgi:hypothetical protein